MKNKFRVIVIILRIELCWLFIKAWQKKLEKHLEEGGVFWSKKAIRRYKQLRHYCDKTIILNYNYQKLTSIEARSMEVGEVIIR